MTHTAPKLPQPLRSKPKHIAVAALLLTTLSSVPAFAGQREADAAVTRADAKIELVTRQAGQAGDNGDQSFNRARERVAGAHVALKANDFDTAERLADEAALLAELTGERAVLAALKTSHEALVTSSPLAQPAN